MRRIAVCVALLFAASLAAFAEEPKPSLAKQLNADHPGYSEYQQYCAACHGVFADGKGLVVPVLTEKPADLRHLSARYGTPLSKQKLIRTIDGSEPILAHGSREMPIWGTRLYEQVPNPMSDARQRGAILTILDYLESIQQKGS